MGRFVFWTVVFSISGGLFLYFGHDIWFISPWLGKLPGDFFIKKGKYTVAFPIVSGAIVSFVFCLILGGFSKKKKD